jgi:hypothetical protein
MAAIRKMNTKYVATRLVELSSFNSDMVPFAKVEPTSQIRQNELIHQPSPEASKAFASVVRFRFL